MGTSDEMTAAIDRTFDGAEGFVRGVGKFLGVDVDEPAPGEVIRAGQIPEASIAAIPLAAGAPVRALPNARVIALPPAGGTGVTQWKVIPLRTERGETVFAVTDGERGAVATTRAAADALLALLSQGSPS